MSGSQNIPGTSDSSSSSLEGFSPPIANRSIREAAEKNARSTSQPEIRRTSRTLVSLYNLVSDIPSCCLLTADGRRQRHEPDGGLVKRRLSNSSAEGGTGNHPGMQSPSLFGFTFLIFRTSDVSARLAKRQREESYAVAEQGMTVNSSICKF